MATTGSDKQCTISNGSWLQSTVIVWFAFESPIMIGYFTQKIITFHTRLYQDKHYIKIIEFKEI